MAAAQIRPGREHERPASALGTVDHLVAALKLVVLSLLPIAAAAVGFEQGQLASLHGAGLIAWLTVGGIVALWAVESWTRPRGRDVALAEVPWANSWFRPWVVAGSWWGRHWAGYASYRFDDEGPWFMLPIAGLAALLVGVTQLPPEFRADLEALGGGDPVLGPSLVILVAYLLLCADSRLARLHAGLDAGGPPRRPSVSRRTMAVAIVVVALLWLLRPLWHGLAMVFIQYPLATWLPLGASSAIAALVSAWVRTWSLAPGLPRPQPHRVRRPLMLVGLALGLAFLPSLESRALFDATVYADAEALPPTSQPRLLPKAAAETFAARGRFHLAHLVVDPSTDRLVWSAEERRAALPRGASSAIGIQPLDRTYRAVARHDGGFDPAVSSYGPGSLLWRAYRRHFATRVQDPVIVPLEGGGAVAVAPYVGYRGFPVRRPYLRGVYVYHQDGRLEDLTPEEAMERPELVRSGRLFPERLARHLAEAHARHAPIPPGGARGSVGDPEGNPQPYLTNLGDGRIRWLTVAHADGDPDAVTALYQTDAGTGATTVWRPPAGRRVLSNEGAATLTRALPIRWTDPTGTLPLRSPTEPRPTFVDGRLHYLVSVVRHPGRGAPSTDADVVEQTVVIDAHERQVAETFDHVGGTDERLRQYFGTTP